MGILSGSEIRRRLAIKGAQSIVVSPLLEPDEQVRKYQASLDVRLGFNFALALPSTYGAIDEFEARSRNEIRTTISLRYKSEYIPFGGKMVIHPHQFILASSLEYIRLPSDIMARISGRSTWGRLGLSVATATSVHPLFAGTLKLELRNLGEAPLVLRPGQSIGQLFFETIESPHISKNEQNQYSGSIDLLPRNMSSIATYKRIRGFIERHLVRDVMHSQNAIPIVSIGTSISDAIIIMTRKCLGCVIVTTPDGQLAGIITDGDLRRKIMSEPLNGVVEKVMTSEPKTIGPNQSIDEAFDIMQSFHISVLIVVDRTYPVGVIHLHDLALEGRS